MRGIVNRARLDSREAQDSIGGLLSRLCGEDEAYFRKKVFVNVCESPNVMMFCTSWIALDNKGVDCAAYDCLCPRDVSRVGLTRRWP